MEVMNPPQARSRVLDRLKNTTRTRSRSLRRMASNVTSALPGANPSARPPPGRSSLMASSEFVGPASHLSGHDDARAGSGAMGMGMGARKAPGRRASGPVVLGSLSRDTTGFGEMQLVDYEVGMVFPQLVNANRYLVNVHALEMKKMAKMPKLPEFEEYVEFATRWDGVCRFVQATLFVVQDSLLPAAKSDDADHVLRKAIANIKLLLWGIDLGEKADWKWTPFLANLSTFRNLLAELNAFFKNVDDLLVPKVMELGEEEMRKMQNDVVGGLKMEAASAIAIDASTCEDEETKERLARWSACVSMSGLAESSNSDGA